MLVLCDIRELFSVDLKDKILASSSGHYKKTSSFPREYQSLSKDGKPLLVTFKKYFCSGLMLINMQQWRAQNIESKCLEFLNTYKTILADQDALNVAIQDSIMINPVYGIMLYFKIIANEKEKIYYDEAVKNAKIIHHNGPAKAWSNFAHFADKQTRALVFDRWWDIAFKTQGFIDIFENLHKEMEKNTLHDVLSMSVAVMDTKMQLFLPNIHASLSPLTNGIYNSISCINDRLNTIERRVNRVALPHKAFKNWLKKIFKS